MKEAELQGRASQRIEEEVMEVGQKVVFVRDAKVLKWASTGQ
jgi:hypothetical protein